MIWADLLKLIKLIVINFINNFTKKLNIVQRQFLYFFLLIAVQMVLIGFFSFYWISSYLENTYVEKMREINQMMFMQSNTIRDNYEKLSDSYLANTTLQSLLMQSPESSNIFEASDHRKAIGQLLADPHGVIDAVIVQGNSIVFQANSNSYKYFIDYNQIKDTAAYKRSLQSGGRNLWVTANENMMTQNKEPFLYVCRTLNSIEVNPKILGQLIIQIPFEQISGIFKQYKLQKGEYYAIIDSDGNYIYRTGDLNLLGKKADKHVLSILGDTAKSYKTVNISNEDFLIAYSVFKNDTTVSEWNVVHVLPMSVIISNAGNVRNIMLLIMLLSLFVTMPLLMLLSRSISRPVIRLESIVEQFGNGNLAVRAKTDRTDEIGQLQISFNKMAVDINDLLIKNAEENKQLRLMELNILEYQINPHFLYNTLDSINWMAQKSGNEDIEEIINALARFFRLGLSKGREFYKVKDELEHVTQYLLINKIRFKDCFEFEIISEPDVLECTTLKIILQPIAENAIKHGINKKCTNGFIRISAKREGNDVLFEVSDNGAGINNARLKSIQNVLNKHTLIDLDSANGFGLFNVNQRIWMHFGDDYGITILSSPQTGTTVRLKIPITEQDSSAVLTD